MIGEDEPSRPRMGMDFEVDRRAESVLDLPAEPEAVPFVEGESEVREIRVERVVLDSRRGEPKLTLGRNDGRAGAVALGNRHEHSQGGQDPNHDDRTWPATEHSSRMWSEAPALESILGRDASGGRSLHANP